MCGIAGFVDSSITRDEARERIDLMLRAIHHRGPECSATFAHEDVTLGHNRLKIIDLSDAANQPFYYQSVTVVFNGEIYNYRELRKTLESKGYSFSTHSDTEVLCASWMLWGEECVQHFVGMWAFALYDEKTKRLFCSRDRFGIKPFYYYQTSSGFYFASEIKALKKLPHFSSSVNQQQLIRGIQTGQVCFQDQTYYAAVKQLQPGWNLQITQGKWETWPYYTIPVNIYSPASFEEKKAIFRARFEDSIALHSRSDVRNGICLSGGLDSSSIASMFSTLYPDTSIQSFTIFYEGQGGVDERSFVHSVAQKYPNITPHFFSPADDEIASAYEQCALHADVPVPGSTYISQYFLMQLASRHGVTVLLDGQGADEFLGGYLHTFHRLISSLSSHGHPIQALQLLQQMAQREHLSLSQIGQHFLKSVACTLFSESRIQQIEWEKGVSRYTSCLPEKNPPVCFAENRMDDFLLHLIYHTTLPTLLQFEDRNSMAFSLESRVPFLDHRLVEFGFQLLNADKINQQAETKYILRESLRDILPEAVYARRDKKGFVTPGEVRWLNGPLKFLLTPSRIHPFFKINFVQQTIKAYQAGDRRQAKLLWRILTTNDWLNRND